MANFSQFLPIVFIVATLCFGYFLWLTDLASSPLALFGITIFLLTPLRKEHPIVRRILLLVVISFVLWLFQDLGVALLPFAISFLLAYLTDPSVSWLERKKVPRWLAALTIVLCMGGIVTMIAIFVFPAVFSQLDDIISQVSSFVTNSQRFLESRKFYRMLDGLGLPKDTLKDIVQNEFAPRIESVFTSILQALASLLTSLSLLASQVINVILIPILSFYFVKDLPKLKTLLREILTKKDKKVFHDVERVNAIVRTYIGWQIVAAFFIGTVSSILFAIFGVPYPIVLGIICGLLNPIPIFGTIASMIIAIVTILLINPDNATGSVIVVTCVINGLHFVNAYGIEPRVLGEKIGLHPIILLASLFIFSHFFGFWGLLIAVPVTAVLVMFFRDWKEQGTLPLHINTSSKTMEYAREFLQKVKKDDEPLQPTIIPADDGSSLP